VLELPLPKQTRRRFKPVDHVREWINYPVLSNAHPKFSSQQAPLAIQFVAGGTVTSVSDHMPRPEQRTDLAA
jgi:hypothetical protein